jgi:hypothetical protein
LPGDVSPAAPRPADCAGYGAYGLVVNDIYLPGNRSPGRHFHGASALMMFMMLASLGVLIITISTSSYDPIRKRMTNGLLYSLLIAAVMCFMLAGFLLA